MINADWLIDFQAITYLPTKQLSKSKTGFISIALHKNVCLIARDAPLKRSTLQAGNHPLHDKGDETLRKLKNTPMRNVLKKKTFTQNE